MSLRPCIDCGEPTPATRCPEHDTRARRPSREAGYDHAWDKLSRRARAIQPWCSDCGATEQLTADHLPEAWARKAAGKVIRLRDVDVLCSPCNSRRGSSRTGGDRPPAEVVSDGAVRRGARYSLPPLTAEGGEEE